MKRAVCLALSLVLACLVASPVAFVADSVALAQGSAAKPKGKAKPKPRGEKAAPKIVQKGPPPRIPFTAQDQAAASIPGFPDVRGWGDSAADFHKVLPPQSGPWLAMSGGGADGAFAAGVLNGWSQSGKRPQFTVVTGVSIGALLAPYTFLGSKYDEDLRQAIVTITGADIFEDRQTHESFLDTWPLRRLIEKRVTPELLAAIAAEHRNGRRLLVVTTNVDAGRRVVWTMGAIAEKGDAAALKLFRDVLLASSAIPGFFAPVLIDVEANGKTFQEMHIDGSVTSAFFVAPEALFATGSKLRLPATELYIMLNGRLTPDFHPPERTTVAILSRLISVVLRASLKAESLLWAAHAPRLGMPIFIAQVADSFDHPAHGLFDEKYMHALYQHGLERALNGSAMELIGQPAPELRTGNP
ncbi:MAG: patatin-like phospholipase family protein [Hyphomicrobiales bacterium]|nr:patatin-like phospholipase family protein [Hyphomicrobiales bacterium]